MNKTEEVKTAVNSIPVGKVFRPGDLEVDLPNQEISFVLSRLNKKGLIESRGRGYYVRVVDIPGRAEVISAKAEKIRERKEQVQASSRAVRVPSKGERLTDSIMSMPYGVAFKKSDVPGWDLVSGATFANVIRDLKEAKRLSSDGNGLYWIGALERQSQKSQPDQDTVKISFKSDEDEAPRGSAEMPIPGGKEHPLKGRASPLRGIPSNQGKDLTYDAFQASRAKDTHKDLAAVLIEKRAGTRMHLAEAEQYRDAASQLNALFRIGHIGYSGRGYIRIIKAVTENDLTPLRKMASILLGHQDDEEIDYFG